MTCMQDGTQPAQTGLFSRILRRATSRRNLSPKIPGQYETIPEMNHQFDSEDRAALRPKSPTKKKISIRSRFYSEPKPVPAEIKRTPADIYVPRHAATDFARMSLQGPRRADTTGRYRSLDLTKENGRLSFAPQPRPGTARTLPNNRGSVSDASHQEVPLPQIAKTGITPHAVSSTDGVARPVTSATADTLEPNDVGENGEATESTTLQPPPTPSNRNFSRRSIRPTPDPHEAMPAGPQPEMPQDPSDFQVFMQKAIDEDQKHREDPLRTISQRTGRKVAPNHPDLNMSACGLERSGTFGGSRRNSRRTSNGYKRTSVVTRGSGTDNKRKSFVYGEENAGFSVGTDTQNCHIRQRSSLSTKIQEYVKPAKVPSAY